MNRSSGRVDRQPSPGRERLAVELGCESVVLDTTSSVVEAIEMYLRAGYSATERDNDNPFAHRRFRKASRRSCPGSGGSNV
jgi:hypothetical protein